jgi:hypothetical protein
LPGALEVGIAGGEEPGLRQRLSALACRCLTLPQPTTPG